MHAFCGPIICTYCVSYALVCVRVFGCAKLFPVLISCGGGCGFQRCIHPSVFSIVVHLVVVSTVWMVSVFCDFGQSSSSAEIEQVVEECFGARISEMSI